MIIRVGTGLLIYEKALVCQLWQNPLCLLELEHSPQMADTSTSLTFSSIPCHEQPCAKGVLLLIGGPSEVS